MTYEVTHSANPARTCQRLDPHPMSECPEWVWSPQVTGTPTLTLQLLEALGFDPADPKLQKATITLEQTGPRNRDEMITVRLRVSDPSTMVGFQAEEYQAKRVDI